MMKMISLQAKSRDMKVASKVLRREDTVPCVLYGNESENMQLQCEYSELFRVYAKAGESTIVDLDADGKKIPVLFHEVQFEPVSDKITHVDFYAVNMKKEIEARVPLNLIGESEAVKGLGGVMVTVMDHLTVKCLPTDLPSSIDVQIERLADFGDAILVSDVVVPSGVEIVEEDDAMIATVQEPRKEAEPETTEGEVAEGAEGAAEGAKAEGGEGEEKKEGGEEKSE